MFINFAAFLGALNSDKDKSVIRDTNTIEEEEKKPITLEPSEESENDKIENAASR